MNRVELMETVRAYQLGGLTRRQFLIKSTAVLGSVASAHTLLAACNANPNANPPPVVDESASTPAASTPSANLVNQTVTYPGANGEELVGYLAYLPDGPPRPGVIVIQEWWGLNNHIKDVADRFAHQGYVALAPDLYHGVVTTEPDEARKQAMALVTAEAVSEIQAAIEYLKTHESVNGRFAAVGFCMGGGLVLQMAVVSDDLAAVVPFYGSPVSPSQAESISAATLSFLGTQDGIPASGYEAMHAALDKAGVPNKFQLYDGAQHAFFNDTRPSYDETAAKDAWAQTLAWFGTHLG